MTSLARIGYFCEAYANWSRWVAHCGRCPRAVQLQISTPMFECDFCGAVTEIIWPTLQMIQSVERILMMRPDPSTRNWTPGETLHDLMFENGEHGILQPPPNVPAGETLFVLEDNGVRIDNLPALVKPRIRREIS